MCGCEGMGKRCKGVRIQVDAMSIGRCECMVVVFERRVCWKVAAVVVAVVVVAVEVVVVVVAAAAAAAAAAAVVVLVV